MIFFFPGRVAMRIGRWVIGALCLTSLLGCGRGESAPAAVSPGDATLVSVAAPVQKTIRYTVEQPGRIEPFEQTPIYARIAGYVRTVRVEIGDQVKKGDLLAELDVPELVAARARKVALVEQARLGIVQAERAEKVAEASVASAKAAVEVTRAAQAKAVAAMERWRSECQRMERLAKEKILDRQSSEEVRNQCRAAEAGKEEADALIRAAEAAQAEALARRDRARADSEAARNQLLVAEADEREASALLGFSRITAPYDGVVADRKVDTGHFLPAATGGTTKGEPLFVVLRIDKVRAFVEVPETDAIVVRAGSPGRIRVQVNQDREYLGQVAGTSWSLDPSQRTLRTEIDFPNPEGSLRPGMYVHALIDVERPNAWVLPAAAIAVRDGQSYCYRLRDGKTQCLPVRLGLRDRDSVEIVKFQEPPRSADDRATWVSPTGKEDIVAGRANELIDNQPVTVSPAK
jgi:HlyD family secretion protein